MNTIMVWRTVHDCRYRPSYSEEWTEWINFIDSVELYTEHSTALFEIQKRVANACDKLNGKVIKRDSCPSDGWEYYEWEENHDGIIQQHIMQITGKPEYVCID